MDWERLGVPVGVSVWKDPRGERIVAAAYVWTDGFEWCHAGHALQPPSGPEELAHLAGREYFPLFDDEKTLVVGPLAFAQAFLRAAVSSGLEDPSTLASLSWPSGDVQEMGAWPPIDLAGRVQLRPEVPWDDPGLFPVNESARMAKYRKLQSRYRHEVLHAKPGASGNYAALESYLDADEVAANPQLNFLNPVAFAHALEREVVDQKQGVHFIRCGFAATYCRACRGASTCSGPCAPNPSSSAFSKNSSTRMRRQSATSFASGRRSRLQRSLLTAPHSTRWCSTTRPAARGSSA